MIERFSFTEKWYYNTLFVHHCITSDVMLTELQFQLVMRGLSVKEPPNEILASNDEQENNFASSSSAVQVLTTEEALTLDDVEANLKRLRAELHEAKSRNIYLYNLVEEQKR